MGWKDRIPGSKKNPIKAISTNKELNKTMWHLDKWKGNPVVDRELKIQKEYSDKQRLFRNTKWLNATRVKQVLPTVGRTIGVASGWGALIAGASLLAQTKKAKKFREDPIHRKATIKKLFKVRN